MKKFLKAAIIIAILLMFGYILSTTYSKYTDNASARIEQDIGRWNIKINNTDITVGEEPVEFEITNFTWNTSEHVKAGKVAPGMRGQFEILIDPTDTDVSIKYALKIDNSKFTESNDINLKIKTITLNGEEYTYETTSTGGDDPDDTGTEIEIDLIKPLSEIQSTDPDVRIDQILVNVEWENNEQFNEKDSEIGRVPNNVITLPITVSVIQYTGSN